MKEKIRNFISETFMFGSSVDDLGDETSLFQSGVIDSTGVFELVSFLQEEFSITVEDTDLIPQNLDSINNLVRFLEAKGVSAALTPCI